MKISQQRLHPLRLDQIVFCLCEQIFLAYSQSHVEWIYQQHIHLQEQRKSTALDCVKGVPRRGGDGVDLQQVVHMRAVYLVTLRFIRVWKKVPLCFS